MRIRNLLVVLFVSLFLRSVNLESIPRWDWDEGENLNIIMHLAEGKAQCFALKFPFVPHPPLFFVLAVLFTKLSAPTVLSVRVFCVLLSVATTALIYLIGSKLFGEQKGFLAGILYAVYPVAVYWGRIGMINNLIVFLSVLSMYFFQRFLEGKRRVHIVLSGFLSGLCFITGFVGVSAMAAVCLLTLKYSRKNFNWVIVSSLIAPLAFILYELAVMPDYFIPEVIFQFKRFNLTSEKVFFGVLALCILYLLRGLIKAFIDPMRETATELPVVGFILLSLYALIVLRVSDSWYYHGFSDYLTYVFSVGFIVKPVFFVKEEEKKHLILSFFLSCLLFLVAVDRADHMSMVTYPYLPLVASNFIVVLFNETRSFLKRKEVRFYALAAFVLVYHPLFVALVHSLGVTFGLTVARQEVSGILLVSDYVNGIVSKDSVVIGYSWMTNLVRGKFCIVGQSAAYDGHKVAYYSDEYPKGQWVFNCSYHNADVIVVSDGTRDIMREYAGFEALADGISSWRREYVGGFGVYLNPNKRF